MLQEFVPRAENLESLDLGWNPIGEKGFEAWEGLRVAGSSKRRLKLSLYESLVAQKLQDFLDIEVFLVEAKCQQRCRQACGYCDHVKVVCKIDTCSCEQDGR